VVPSGSTRTPFSATLVELFSGTLGSSNLMVAGLGLMLPWARATVPFLYRLAWVPVKGAVEFRVTVMDLLSPALASANVAL
jgi:hypothetical protein